MIKDYFYRKNKDDNNQIYNNDLKKNKKITDYISLSSSISGFIFSGIGYTVASTGSLINDLGTLLVNNVDKIPYYLTNLNNPNTVFILRENLGEVISKSNYYGGVGAAIGMAGGIFVCSKIKNTGKDVTTGLLSLLKKLEVWKNDWK